MLTDKINETYNSLLKEYKNQTYYNGSVRNILSEINALIDGTKIKPAPTLIKELYIHTIIKMEYNVLDDIMKIFEEPLNINSKEVQEIYSSYISNAYCSLGGLKNIKKRLKTNYIVDEEFLKESFHNKIFCDEDVFKKYKLTIEKFTGIKLTLDEERIQKLYAENIFLGKDKLATAFNNTGIKIKLTKEKKRAVWNSILHTTLSNKYNIDTWETLVRDWKYVIGTVPKNLTPKIENITQKTYNKLFSDIGIYSGQNEKHYISNWNDYNEYTSLLQGTYDKLKEIKNLEKKLKIPIKWDENKTKIINSVVNQFVRNNVGLECVENYNLLEELIGLNADENLKQEICLNLLGSYELEAYKKAVNTFNIIPDERMKKAYNLLIGVHGSSQIVHQGHILGIEEAIHTKLNPSKDIDKKILLNYYGQLIEKNHWELHDALISTIGYTTILPTNDKIQQFYKDNLDLSFIDRIHFMYEVTKVKIDLPNNVMQEKYEDLAEWKRIGDVMQLREIDAHPPLDEEFEKILTIYNNSKR